VFLNLTLYNAARLAGQDAYCPEIFHFLSAHMLASLNLPLWAKR
jgi:hypothetical protein